MASLESRPATFLEPAATMSSVSADRVLRPDNGQPDERADALRALEMDAVQRAKPRLRALLWDVDGTLAETECDGHLPAFNEAFEACGLSWRWDDAHYGALLAVTGGRERVLHDMALRGVGPERAVDREALALQVHRIKNCAYARRVAQGHVRLRDGVRSLLNDCRAQKVRLAIVTTSSRSNVQALLSAQLGPAWTQRFEVTVCGEDVARKKPDPEAYVIALRQLGLTPCETVAIEDSPAGAAAARAAGVPVVVTQSRYFELAAFDAVMAIGPGLHTRQGWRPVLTGTADALQVLRLADIRSWHAQFNGAEVRP